jgi:fluoroacetyl-CoA thioesterase
MELAPGLKHVQSVQVTLEMTPAHLRADPLRVLATPDMVRLVEQTAIQAVQPLLKPGQATVGTRIDIAHLAGTPEGMTVTVAVELTAVDRRRLSFRFEVHDETEKVGEGTHERFVIDREQRMPRLQAKLDAWRAR